MTQGARRLRWTIFKVATYYYLTYKKAGHSRPALSIILQGPHCGKLVEHPLSPLIHQSFFQT